MRSKFIILSAIVALVQSGCVHRPDVLEKCETPPSKPKFHNHLTHIKKAELKYSGVDEIIHFINNFASNFPSPAAIEEANSKIIPNYVKPHVARKGLSVEDSELLESLVKVSGIAAFKSEYKPSTDPHINAWSMVSKTGAELQAAFTQFYGLNDQEVEAVRAWSIWTYAFGCDAFQLKSALDKLPPFIGPVVRNTKLNQQSITKLEDSLSKGTVVYIRDFVRNINSSPNDVGMATAPIGHGEVFPGRPFQLIIMSKTGRYICPIKDLALQNQPEVLFLNSISSNGFAVLGKSVVGRLIVYYMKEL